MVAGFIPEWWPTSNRNGGRLRVGKGGRNKSEFALYATTFVTFGNSELSANSERTNAFSLIYEASITFAKSLDDLPRVGIGRAGEYDRTILQLYGCFNALSRLRPILQISGSRRAQALASSQEAASAGSRLIDRSRPEAVLHDSASLALPDPKRITQDRKLMVK